MTITSIPVAAGDNFFVAIRATNSSSAILLFENLTQGVAYQQTFNSPGASSNLQGSSAEWIVENERAGPLVNFGTITFTNIGAGTSTGANLNLATANLSSLVNLTSSNTISSFLTRETILSDTSVEIVWALPG